MKVVHLSHYSAGRRAQSMGKWEAKTQPADGKVTSEMIIHADRHVVGSHTRRLPTLVEQKRPQRKKATKRNGHIGTSRGAIDKSVHWPFKSINGHADLVQQETAKERQAISTLAILLARPNRYIWPSNSLEIEPPNGPIRRDQ
jgi:hypothetical protein